MAFEHNLQGEFIPGEEATEASAADHFTYTVKKPMIVRDVGFVVTDTIDNDQTAAVVSLDHTPSGGSRAEKVTITLPDTTAVGVELLGSDAATPITPFVVDVGDTLHFEHKTAGTDTSSADGAGYYRLYYEYIPDGSI